MHFHTPEPHHPTRPQTHKSAYEQAIKDQPILGKRKRSQYERTWSEYLAEMDEKRLKAFYQCKEEDCDEEFHFKRDFDRHMASEHGEGRFRCQHKGCDKAFADSKDLTRHLRVHSGERPFRCLHQGCGKAFKQNGNLTVHMRVHTGERPFRCLHPGCDKAYMTSTHLRRHMRSKKHADG